MALLETMQPHERRHYQAFRVSGTVISETARTRLVSNLPIPVRTQASTLSPVLETGILQAA